MEDQRLIPLVFVLTGAINVLLIKWSDKLVAEGRDGEQRHFQHPIFQAALMFLGQFLCFPVYKFVFWLLKRRGDGSEGEHPLTEGNHDFVIWKFVLPTLMDAVASVLLFTGLYLTYASSFQMIRASSIIFAGIFGAIYLNNSLSLRHWMAMFTIVCGLSIVISSDVQRIVWDHGAEMKVDTNAILTGDLLIICAQVFAAVYLIWGEKYLKEQNIPALLATGWHGIIGLLFIVVLGAGVAFIPANLPFNVGSTAAFDDLADIFYQLRSNPWLIISLGSFVVSSATYNFVALSIIKTSSTENLILADSIRILFVWIMSFLMEWECFSFGLLMGYIIIQMGLINYRNAIFMTAYRSIVAIIVTNRYASMAAGGEQDASTLPRSRPADVI